jgi:heat shock protein HspQ
MSSRVIMLQLIFVEIIEVATLRVQSVTDLHSIHRRGTVVGSCRLGWAKSIGPADALLERATALGTVTSILRARFSVGDLVEHRLFGYRGVIVDVDPRFSATDVWYETMAKSRPPKDRPWYHVLVDGAAHGTYVAERNLEADTSALPIHHPLVEQYFERLEDGRYVSHERVN